MRSSEPFAPAPESGEELEFGEIVGVFGVHGEVRLHLHHRDSTLLDRGLDVVLVDPSGARWRARLTSRPGAGQRVLGRFAATITREQAAELKGWRIRVRVADLPSLEPGEFWVWQVLGADAVIDDEVVGRIREVHATGPVDVFEIQPQGSADAVFVPALRENVLEVTAGRVVLHPEAWPDDDEA